MYKWNYVALIVALLGLTLTVGCQNGGGDQKGGPGADVRSDQDQEPQKEEATFTASLDSESVEVPLGQQKKVTLSIERGDQFDQKVTARIEPPEGLTAEPKQIEYQPGQTEGEVTLQASQDAPVGQELAVEVVFEPETGQSVTKQLNVTVVEQNEGGQQ